MTLANLLRDTLDVDSLEAWENERTPTPVRVFGVRLHSLGLSVRETTAVLRWLGVERSHEAVWAWTHRLADRQPDPQTVKPSRVAVDETAIRVNGQWRWLYAAIDVETELVLDAEVFGRRGTDPAAAFLHRVNEKHDLFGAVFLVDQFGYRTSLTRFGPTVSSAIPVETPSKSGVTRSTFGATVSMTSGWSVVGVPTN